MKYQYQSSGSCDPEEAIPMTRCHLQEEATQQELCHHCVHLHDYQDYHTKHGEIYQCSNPEHEPTYHGHTILPNICPMHLQQLQLQSSHNRISFLSSESNHFAKSGDDQKDSNENSTTLNHGDINRS